MLALAQARNRDTHTRAANDDDIFGGPRTRTKYQYDFDLDGTFDAHQAISYEYGASGELLNFASDTFSQDYVDVFPGGVTKVTNTEFADGVLQLAQEYLDFRGSVVAAH